MPTSTPEIWTTAGPNAEDAGPTSSARSIISSARFWVPEASRIFCASAETPWSPAPESHVANARGIVSPSRTSATSEAVMPSVSNMNGTRLGTSRPCVSLAMASAASATYASAWVRAPGSSPMRAGTGNTSRSAPRLLARLP